jgi:hypothetical protein
MSRGTRIRIGKLVVNGGDAHTIEKNVGRVLQPVPGLEPRTIPAIGAAVAQAVTKKKEGR